MAHHSYVVLPSSKIVKSTKTGLRWKLASLCTYMSFEIHPMFHKIFIRSSQSSPIWTENFFSSFLSKNGEYSQFFDLHTQYLHQMKAQTILHSNLIPKMIFLTKNILKNLMQIGLSTILALNSIQTLFLERTFFEKKLETKNFMISNAFEHQKWDLHNDIRSLALS